ncbi:MAG: hypothetical protein MIO93_09305 [ANME-2 cluster archaeon]|jgi:hypothetical protein|nr:hypothetical protein [ANME-2 cluster archaeon]
MNRNFVEAFVTRKPNGTPLCVEILLNPDQVYIPFAVERIDYDLKYSKSKKTLVFRLQECEDCV